MLFREILDSGSLGLVRVRIMATFPPSFLGVVVWDIADIPLT